MQNLIFIMCHELHLSCSVASYGSWPLCYTQHPWQHLHPFLPQVLILFVSRVIISVLLYFLCATYFSSQKDFRRAASFLPNISKAMKACSFQCFCRDVRSLQSCDTRKPSLLLIDMRTSLEASINSTIRSSNATSSASHF